jgi:hypothetical protein
MSAIVGPVALYSNVPIHPEYYNPSRFVISAIGLGLTTLITTTNNNNYYIGQEVRFIIPPSFGCRQLNGLSGIVISIPNPNQIKVNIDSTKFDPLVSSLATTLPQVLAIGGINSGAINTNGNMNEGTFIPGSFINVSPL